MDGVGGNVVVRRAVPADSGGICAAHLASIRGVCSKDYTPEQIESWCVGKTPEVYPPLIERFIWYVAVGPSGIAGFGALDISTAPEAAEVQGLYVDAQYVGRGVGAALLDRLLADARAAGAGRVWVKGTITAEPFYRRCGFVVTGRATHLSRGGIELPSVMMELILK